MPELTPDANAQANEVIFTLVPAKNGFFVGVASLNRPKQLNALNLTMCQRLLSQLRQWQSNEQVVAVLLKGEGDKGFCAGGDVAQVVSKIRTGGADRFEYGDEFFAVEYALDLLIHEYSKPIISWAHGVTMGGGVGLSCAAGFRVVSETSRIAMPEIHIGLFPDVGGGWFLNRMPGASGLLMALSGLQINEADAIFGGLADYFVPYAQQAQFLTQLQAIDWGKTKLDHQHQTMHFCREFCAPFKPQLTESFLKTNFDLICHGVARAKVSGVKRGLNEIAKQNPGFEQAAKSLNAGSPTAAAVVFEYMQRTRRLSLREVLALDYVLAKNFQRQHDFAEGVRALLIDKDKLPNWQPAQLADVSDVLIAAHFSA